MIDTFRFVVWQQYKLGKRGGKSRRKRHGREQLFLALLFLLVVALTLVGCDPNAQPNPTEIPDCPPTLTPDPTDTLTLTQPPGLPPNTPTPIPTITPRPTNPPPTPTETQLPPSIDSLVLGNPFASDSYWVVVEFGSKIGYQQRLDSHSSAIGHAGADLVSETYVNESIRNWVKDDNFDAGGYYRANSLGRRVYAPVSGILKKGVGTQGENRYILTIENIRLNGSGPILENARVRLIHVNADHLQIPANGLEVVKGQFLGVDYQGRGYGFGSERPHLHLDVREMSGNNFRFVDPLPMLPTDKFKGYYDNSPYGWALLPYDG